MAHYAALQAQSIQTGTLWLRPFCSKRSRSLNRPLTLLNLLRCLDCIATWYRQIDLGSLLRLRPCLPLLKVILLVVTLIIEILVQIY